jgi:two-component sensor histidine kinase
MLDKNKVRIGFIYIVIFFFSISLKAKSTPDSLKKVSLVQKDSILVDTYFNLFKYYFKKEHQPDSMLKYAQLSYSISEKNQLKGRLVKSKRGVVLSYMELQQVDIAKKNLNEGLDLAKKYNNVSEIVEMNNLFGFIYGKENELDKSAYYYLNSAKEYEKIKDYPNLAFTYKNVIVIFTLLDQFPKILRYTNKTLELLPKINQKENPEIVSGIYSSAAQHYLYVGEKKNKKSLIDSSLIFADSCLKVALRFDIKQGLSDAYYILALDLLKRKEYKKSESYFYKALEDRSNIMERAVFNIYSSLVNLKIKKEEYSEAKLFIDTCKSLPISKELDGPLMIAELEYYLYKGIGDSAKALIAHENLMKETKIILENAQNKLINDLETKYQSELKEEKIAKLNQQQEIDRLQIRSLFGFAGVTILAIIVIIFFYRQSTIKSKLKVIETEQRLNRARMDPHFFFNALSSLQGLVNDDKRKKEASDYVSNFSKIMRQSLESTYIETLSIEDEIDFLKNYLELQKLRTGNKFNYNFVYDKDLEINELLIPSMILQPFIENSIEHGFVNKEQGGFITIGFATKENNIVVSIVDNGIGLGSNTKNKNHTSRAIQIIKDRLYLLNQKHKTNATFVVEENLSGGTKVEIVLPILN